MTSIRTKPKAPVKVKMFIEIAKHLIKEGIIFEEKRSKRFCPWEN